MKELVVVKCPICGQEYLPSEIFMPESVFGKQYDITKDESGCIKFYLGDDPDYEEIYVCDSCGSKLKINMKMTFDVEQIDNEEDYETKINKPKKLNLKEEDLF